MSDFLDWDELADDVTDILGEFQTVTLRKLTQGAYVDGAVTGPTNTDTYPKGAVFDFERFRAGETLQNGTLIQSSDKRLLLDTSGGKPALDDHIFLASGEEWVIANIQTIGPAGTDVAYDCTIRQ